MPVADAFIAFDLDGTLADTAEDMVEAANRAFDEMGHGRPLDLNAEGGLAMQLGGRAMLKRGYQVLGLSYDDDLVESGYPLVLGHYNDTLCIKSRLYNGVSDTLAMLSEAGYAIGVCTNKPEKLARRLLDELGILDAFGSLIGADTLPVRKPSPEPLWETISRGGGDRNRAILIGDSQTDLKCANAANVGLGLVTFGPEREAVRNWGADIIIPSFAELPQLLDRYFAK